MPYEAQLGGERDGFQHSSRERGIGFGIDAQEPQIGGLGDVRGPITAQCVRLPSTPRATAGPRAGPRESAREQTERGQRLARTPPCRRELALAQGHGPLDDPGFLRIQIGER